MSSTHQQQQLQHGASLSTGLRSSYRDLLAASKQDEEIKLDTQPAERERFDNLADLYSIIVCVDHLEKAYIRDLIPASEYAPACSKLIAQYRTALNLASDSVRDVEQFMQTYNAKLPAALNRLRIGVPATVEHAQSSATDSGSSAKYVAETVQLFITLMDSLKLNMVAVDQIHPLLSDLMQSLNKVSTLPPNFEGKTKIKQW